MSGGKAVNANVVVFDPVTGQSTLVEKGKVPPKAIADQLGDHLFTTPAAEVSDAPPPLAGKGSGRDAWAAYAEGKVDVSADMKRDDIVAALDAAGVPTTADSDDEASAVPARTDDGSGRDAWVAYAEGKVDVSADMDEDDIVGALEAAGFPVEAE